MVKQKKRTWWDRLEVPLASLALAATVFGALRKSGHLAQWQRNNTPWSAANAPAGPPARKKQRLTPGPTSMQVAANALVPVVQAATAVPTAAAHAVVTSTLGRDTADVAASEGRRIAAAVIASVLSTTGSAAAPAISVPAVSVPAVVVPTTTGGVVAVPAQNPVRMEGITRPRRAAAFAPQLQPVHRMEGITRPSRRAAAFAPQLQPVQRAAVAMQGVPGTMVPFRFRNPAYVPAPIARKRPTVFDDDDFARKMPRRTFYATRPDDVPPARTADPSADPPRSVRQRRGAMANDLPRSVRQRRGTMQNVGDRYNQPQRLAGQDGRRTVIPRLPGMDNVRDQ